MTRTRIRLVARHRPRSVRQRGAFTLIELVVVLGIVAVLSLLTGPIIADWMSNQRLRSATRSVADLLLLARAEAIRTGNRHVVFFGPPGTSDPAGNAIEDGGAPVPMLVLVDGAPAAADCEIGAGEDRRALQPVDDVLWGVSQATVRAPKDEGVAPFAPPQASGGTFADPSNNPVPWFLFRPDGIPVVFEGVLGGCGTIGQTGTGGAAFYLTNGKRDYAVVLSPAGGVRIHSWNEATGQWRS